MRKLLILIMTLMVSVTSAYATLTVGQVPVTKTGGTTPTLQNGSITDTGTSAGAGNVGVGSTNPQQALDVNGNINTNGFISITGTGDSYISTGNVGIGTFATVFASLAIKNVTNTTGLLVGSTYSLQNLPGIPDGAAIQGNVGIGTSMPSSLFQVGVNKLQVLSAGNVGIGSATPGQALDVNGTVRMSQQVFVSGIATDATKTDATVCEDTTTHQFYSGSGTLGICLGTSTMLAKQNIIPISEGINQIMALKPVSFNYRPGWGYDVKKPYYGFIAEQVSPVLPRLVGRDVKGTIKNADYVGMIPVMVKSIQQIQIEIYLAFGLLLLLTINLIFRKRP